VRQDLLTIYEDFIWSIFTPCEMTTYIRALREQIAILIFSLPNRKKIYSAYSPNALNEQNLGLSQYQYWDNMKKFRILSFHPR
jgi:hypothetical protein